MRPPLLALVFALLLATPLKITVDTSDAPDLAPWAAEAKALVETWHPKIAALLASDNFTPPSAIFMTYKKNFNGVAATSASKILIAASWVRDHPEDKGMIVHELVHVIQSYPPSHAGWLVEGIADYIRFFHFEPQTKLILDNPAKAGYRDGYRTTALFLAWIEKTHDKQIIPTLNNALRQGAYRDEIFQQATHKSLDALWAEFIKSL